MRLTAENIRRVVVRGTNWVGDAAMSVAALRELRRVLPDAEITLCTRRPLDGLFADADFLDDILIYERQKSKLRTVFDQAKIWRERRFDLAILLTNAFESAILAKLGNVKSRIGYATEKRGFLLTDALAVPTWKNERHEVFYYLNIIRELERRLRGDDRTEAREPDASLQISDARRQDARAILRSHNVDFSTKIIALCPGSTNSRAKRWPIEHYAALIDLLRENSRISTILIGAPDELEVSRAVYELARRKPVLLTGRTDLAEVAAVLSIVDLLVTNDTGPAHIAPAVGTKTIVIFGPTIPATTRPFSDSAQIIRRPPACAPCMLRDCPIDHRCLTAISPTEVFQTVKNNL